MKWFIALMVLVLPAYVWAQESETISEGAQLGLTVYELALPVVLAALGWLSTRLALWLKAKTKNEVLAGILIRLNQSVFEGVKFVNEGMVDLIGKAKDPASPGGVAITKEEAKQLKAAALDYVKSYWGAKGIKEMGKVLGFGGDPIGLEKMLTNKIGAAVNDVKRVARNPK